MRESQMTKNPLQQLVDVGQSPWCDNIRRSEIATKLTDKVQKGEITGLTSNPTIFEKAMVGSADYDDAFVPLAKAGRSADEIFDALAVEDIQSVADLLRPVYDRFSKKDGYV